MKNMMQSSFEDRVAEALGRMADQVHEPPGGPPPGLLHRAYRRMSLVAIGTALVASVVGLAGSLVFGLLTGDGPSFLPHSHGSSQLALGGIRWGDQPSEDHAATAILRAAPSGNGWVLTGANPVPRPPRYQPPPVPSGGGGFTNGPVVVRAGGGIHGKGSGRHRRHRGGHHHRRHRGGGHRRMH